jgi:hypothetical protein
VSDPGVEQCGSLSMNLPEVSESVSKAGRKAMSSTPREIQAKMLFGDTEIKASAKDVHTGQTVRVNVDFLCESNPKYTTKL